MPVALSQTALLSWSFLSQDEMMISERDQNIWAMCMAYSFVKLTTKTGLKGKKLKMAFGQKKVEKNWEIDR